MPSLHATAFLKNPAAQPPAAVTVLFGTERHLQRQVFDSLRTTVFGDAEDEDIALTQFAGKDVVLKTVLDEVRTISMWGDVRLVTVDDADEFVTEFRAGLENYLKSPAKKSLLLLLVKKWPKTTRLAKEVAKNGLSIECSELKGAALTSWLTDAARDEFGKQISRDACMLVVEMAGTALGLLSQELAKLASYVGDRDRITPDDVRAVVGGWTTQTAFKMIDAVIAGRLNLALKLLDELLNAGESPYRILGAITSSFRKLATATDATAHGTNLKAALAAARIFPNQIRIVESYLRNVGYRQASAIYNRLLEADGNLKGAARISERLALEQLLIQLSGTSRAKNAVS